MPRRSSADLSVIQLNAGASRLRPPASLSEAERTVFVDLVSTNKPEHFQPSDMPLLVRYCEATALGDLAAEHLRTEGAVIGGRPSPWIVVQEKAVRSMLGLSMRLRLSPQARAPNNPSRQRATSAYERLRLTDDRD